MTYSQVVTLVKVICETVLQEIDGEFMHGRTQDESFESARSKSTLVNLLPFEFDKDYTNGNYNGRLTLRALDMDTLDSSLIQRQDRLSKADKVLDKIFRTFNTSQIVYETGFITVISLGNISYRPLYRVDSAIMTGFSASFPLAGIIPCEPEDFTPGEGAQEGPFLLLEDGGRVLLEYLPV
jgi:hypothetical protein